jgi:hypothetical protein
MAERTPWLQATASTPWLVLAVRPSICWWIIGTAIATVAAFGVIAAAMTPPAVKIANDHFTLAAILAVAGVAVGAVTNRRRFGRPAQLATFVALLIIGGAWSGAQQWTRQRQVEYIANRQKQQLRLNALQLSGNLINFLRERRRFVPPPPAAATWDKDQRAIIRFEAETVRMFEQKFAREVRSARDLLALRGYRDRDLDLVYRRPADEFHIRMIAIKLAALAHAIPY